MRVHEGLLISWADICPRRNRRGQGFSAGEPRSLRHWQPVALHYCLRVSYLWVGSWPDGAGFQEILLSSKLFSREFITISSRRRVLKHLSIGPDTSQIVSIQALKTYRKHDLSARRTKLHLESIGKSGLYVGIT